MSATRDAASPGRTRSIHEPMLIELAQWLAKTQQYSANHPACANHAERTHRALVASLTAESPLAFGVMKDRLVHDDDAFLHPAVAQRLAPHLHERAVLALRFVGGISVQELSAFVEVLAVTVQATFDQGGIGELVRARGLTRVQIEELAHEITLEEKRAVAQKARLRTFLGEALRNLLARRSLEGLTSETLLELLEHHDIAVALLEEDPLGVVDAFAGLCLMTQEEERARGEPLRPKLGRVLLALSGHSKARVLVGTVSLVAEFRDAVVWLFDALGEADVAELAFAALRDQPSALDLVFHALEAAVPHEGRRLSAVRRAARFFYDLPVDADPGLLEAAARHPDEHDSYAREKEALAPDAMRVVATRRAFGDSLVPVQSGPAPAAYDGRRTMIEVVAMASRTRRFEPFCARLPSAVAQLARAGSTDGVIGILRGLYDVARGTHVEYKDMARRALGEAVTLDVAEQLLADLDAESATVEGAALEDVTATVRLVAQLRPEAVLDRLEASESRKMRRVILDALTNIGPSLLPHVRAKLASSSWFVVRNAVVLLPYAQGTPADLAHLVGHPNEKVKSEVVRALRAMPADSASMDVLAALVADSAPEVRRAVMPMLRGAMLSPQAIARLGAVAVDERFPEDVRKRLLDVLAESTRDEAAAVLFGLLQPRGLIELSSLRDAAAFALRRSRAPVAPRLFEEGLASPAWRVRKACERAAKELS